MRVFLVDDSTMIRQRLRRMLASMKDVEVVGETGDAREAVTQISRVLPDVVLLDIHLIGGSGIDVLQAVKKQQPAPVVIVLTNYPYPQYKDKCLQSGADYFFVKSTEFDQVIPALHQSHGPTGASSALAD